MEEEGGELTLEVEEGVLLEEDAVIVLQISVEEVKIQITVSQVIKDLINQRCNAIIVKSMNNMHINGGIYSIIRKNKLKISQTT
jgi:hypothetical protein